MLNNNNYDELPIGLYDDEEKATDLWVHLKARGGGDDKKSLFVLKDITTPTQYRGWWLIEHEFVGRRATAFVRADDVLYFDILENGPQDER